MDLGERYYQLSLLGRVSFVEAVAAGALVVHPASSIGPRMRFARGTDPSSLFSGQLPHDEPATMSCDGEFEDQKVMAPWQPEPPTLHIIPLCKKLGTPFVDLITVGRTSGNDILVSDRSVSRFQAFFRQRSGQWYLCDADSKNGTRVAGERLAPRTEVLVESKDLVSFGSVELTFYTADSLFDLLANGL